MVPPQVAVKIRCVTVQCPLGPLNIDWFNSYFLHWLIRWLVPCTTEWVSDYKLILHLNTDWFGASSLSRPNWLVCQKSYSTELHVSGTSSDRFDALHLVPPKVSGYTQRGLHAGQAKSSTPTDSVQAWCTAEIGGSAILHLLHTLLSTIDSMLHKYVVVMRRCIAIYVFFVGLLSNLLYHYLDVQSFLSIIIWMLIIWILITIWVASKLSLGPKNTFKDISKQTH